jgi:ATP-dependent DNA ligase
MLAKLSRELPEGDGWFYEPKWDGFRCIVFRDGDDVELGSRNERPLTRYFPELVEALRANLPERCVLDGEIVIATPTGLDFDALQQRIHPAQSRITRLAAETPASFVAFDLLALDQTDVREEPFAKRRTQLEKALKKAAPPVHVTPATTDPAVAREWFTRFEGAGLDGVVAKNGDLRYRPGERVMMKVKHERTADCVVAGFRWHKNGAVGSLLLGLYDDNGALHHVGVASSFAAAMRKQLVDELEAVRTTDLASHPWAYALGNGDGEGMTARQPGGISRWTGDKDLSFEPVDPVLVCEVAYEHLQGPRFRHSARFRRWRPDREPASCTYAQLEVVPPYELQDVFGSGT